MADAKSKRYEIVSNDGIEAVIHFFDSNETRTYKVVALDTIRTKIQNGEEINLDGCYIKDFSYRELSGYKKFSIDERKPLVKFSAENSFWDGVVDFSFAHFGDGNVSFSGAHFGDGNVFFVGAELGDGDVDFRNAHFGDGNVSFGYAHFGDGDVSFNRTHFGDGDVDFLGAHFGDGNVSFGYAHFGDGNVSFRSADFGDSDVSFLSAEFGDGDVDFCYAHFGDGEISFGHAHFGNGNVAFVRTHFGDGDVDFWSAHFGDGDVSFVGAHFGDGDVSFSDAHFGDGNVFFRFADFGGGNVDFTGTQFEDGEFHFEDITAGGTNFSFKNQTIHSHFTFRFRELKKLVFDNCISHNVIEFQEAIDKETEKPFHNAIKELAFLNFCNLGTIRLNWNDYKDALMAYEGDSEAITDEFKMLKENYHNQGEYDWEDAAYVEFKNRYREGIEVPPFKEGFWKALKGFWKPLKVWCRKALLKVLFVPPFKEGFWKALEGFWKALKVWCRKALLKLLYKVGRYGTDYTSIAKTMVGVWFFWGILYALPFASIYPPKPDGSIDCHWWSPFYYSAITFFTVGYGDLSAQNFYTAALCVAESFLGVFLMSYFSVAVVRKILR